MVRLSFELRDRLRFGLLEVGFEWGLGLESRFRLGLGFVWAWFMVGRGWLGAGLGSGFKQDSGW